MTIPLLCLPGVVLIPGQLLPLQFHGSYFTSTIKTIIEGNKIFGLVSNFNRSIKQNKYNNVKLNCLGTIVEVRSYGTEDEGAILKIKAEGKERFLIKETWSESNRTVMGKVFILPEVNSKHPFRRDVGLSSMGSKFNRKLLSACTQYPAHSYDLYDPDYLMEKIRGHLNQWASFSTKSNETQSSSVYENRTISQATGTNQPNVEAAEAGNAEEDQPTASNAQPANTEISRDAPVSVNTTRTVVTRIVPVRDSESEEEEESSEEEHGFKGEPSQFSNCSRF